MDTKATSRKRVGTALTLMAATTLGIVLIGVLFSSNQAADASSVALSLQGALDWSDSDAQTISEAESQLIADCMASQGFQYTVHAYEPPPPDNALGVESVADVERLAAESDESSFLPQEPRSPAWMAALLGDGSELVIAVEGWELRKPAKGCLAEAEEALMSDREAHIRHQMEVSLLVYELRERALADSSVKAIIGQWSQCMSDAGVEAATPDEAWVMAATERDSSGRRSIAELDLGCKNKVGLLEVWSGAFADHAVTLAEEVSETVQRWEQLKEAQIQEAIVRTATD